MEDVAKCQKCSREWPESKVKRRTFWPTREIEDNDGKVVGQAPKWIKTQDELCPDCYEGLKKALEGVI